MGFLAKASALFVGLRVTTSYHEALQVSDAKAATLKAARKAIRDAIRTAGLRIQFEDRFWVTDFAGRPARLRPDVRPKFFTQGSFAYDLLVDPCQRPPQQLDLDDGMYVIVDYLQNGQPALVAKALFEMVEDALRPLCARRGWTLVDDKNTCVRVQISRDAHVDIPIYSAPRDVAESRELTEAAFAEGRVAKRANRTYAKLPSDKIMLAHRDGTWQQSDPLKLQEWVEACVQRYGEDFRRACRYLKGWRDYRWDTCCLSSITIMVAVEKALRLMHGNHRSLADDQLVYEISQMLPGILGGDLFNPVCPDRDIVLNDWSDEDRADVVAAAKTLAADMNSALKHSADQTLVVNALRRAFGERMPYRPDMVEILPATTAVTSAKAATVASPSVIKSTSG